MIRPLLARLGPFATVFALAFSSAACAEISPVEKPRLDITTDMGFLKCKSEYHVDCLKLRVRNLGRETVEIAVGTEDGLTTMAYPYYNFEGQLSDGQWQSVIVVAGAYLEPQDFVRIKPGDEASLVAISGRDFRLRNKYSLYRAKVFVNSAEWVFSDPIDLGPMAPAQQPKN